MSPKGEIMETAEQFVERKNKAFQNEKNKQIKVKDIGRKGKHAWMREDWVFMPQTGYPEKVFVIERFRRSESQGEVIQKGVIGDVEYRIGYFIVGKIGSRNGRWTWGQYCPFLPKDDLKKLLQLAKNKGVISI